MSVLSYNQIDKLSKINEFENWAYYEGLHWLFWIGPRTNEYDPEHDRVDRELAKVFQQTNAIAECVDHYVNTMISSEPEWSLSKPKSSKGRADLSAAEELLTDWIDSVTPQFLDSKTTQNGDPFVVAATYLLSTGRAYLRVYQPEYLASRPEPYKRIMLQALSPFAVVSERNAQGVLTKLTYNYAEGGREEQTLDYSTGALTIKVFDSDRETPVSENVLYLGYRYSIVEIALKPLINDAMKRLQNSINLALTMKSRNTVLGGFLERLLLNAQPPGYWEPDPSTGQPVFKPTPISLGPGVTAFISGQPIEDAGGNLQGYTNPSVSYRDPIDPQTFITSVNADKELLFFEADLGHLMVLGDGGISGVSRKTLKDNYVSRAKRYGKHLEFAVSEVYSIVLTLLSGSPDLYKPVCQLSYNFGQLLPEEQQLIITANQAGLMSRTTAMKRLGIDDPDAEAELIKREREEDIEAGKLQVGDTQTTNDDEDPNDEEDDDEEIVRTQEADSDVN